MCVKMDVDIVDKQVRLSRVIKFSCYSNLRLIIATNIIVNVKGRCPELGSGVKVIEKILDSYA